MFPVYISSPENKAMTDKNLHIAKTATKLDLEWIIVETGSRYYENEADVYIHEPVRTTPNKSMNAGFKACKGDYVIFLSNDVTVCDEWVEKMLECFKHPDCGIASLGNNEHRDLHADEIIESLYFAVAMMKKEDAWYDPQYNRVWDDTDLVMRLHTKGKKFYKNLLGIVHHKQHATMGEYAGDKAEYEKSRKYFIDKWSEYESDPFFQKLAYGR